jgi:hypothetical protein
MVLRKIRIHELAEVAMRFRKVRRTTYHSHEMHGNSPSAHRGVGSVAHNQTTYAVAMNDVTNQNTSAMRAVFSASGSGRSGEGFSMGQGYDGKVQKA